MITEQQITHVIKWRDLSVRLYCGLFFYYRWLWLLIWWCWKIDSRNLCTVSYDLVLYWSTMVMTIGVWRHVCAHGRLIIIMHVYIAPEPGIPVLRRCTVLLSLIQTCIHPAHISTSKGVYNGCCYYRRKALFKHIAITSCRLMTTLQFPEIRTRDPAATSPTL